MNLSSIGRQIAVQLALSLEDNLSNETLSLKPGSLIQAEVLDVAAPDRAALLIQGVRVTASLQTPVVKGQTLTLQVAGTESNGKIELQLKPSEPNISDWIHTLPTEDRQTANEIVQILQDLKVKAPPSAIQDLVFALKDVHNTPEAKYSALLAQALKLPLQPSVLQALETVFFGDSFAKLLSQFISKTSVHTPQSPPFEPQLPLPVNENGVSSNSGNTTLANRLQSHLYNVGEALSQADANQLAAALKDTVKSLGLNYETEIWRAYTAANQQGKPLLENALATLKALLLKETANQDMPLQQPCSPVQLPDERAMSPDSGSLVAAPQSASFDQDLLENLVGQQLLHGVRTDPTPFVYQHFAVPLWLDKNGDTASADIQIVGRRQGARRIDPDNCTVYLQLDFPTLQRIDILVQVMEKTVSLRIQTNPQIEFPLEEQDLRKLNEGLKGMGYRLGTVKEEKRMPDTPETVFYLIKDLYSHSTSIDLRG